MSIPTPRFLLDENVRIKLGLFLASERFDSKPSPRSTNDKIIAGISKKEKRVLVTNDEDFSKYGRNEIFSVVWLRIPQNEPKTLVNSFAKLVAHLKKFEGRLIVLTPDKWSNFRLGEKIKFES